MGAGLKLAPALLLFLSGTSFAYACDCPERKDLSPEQRKAEKIERADGYVTVKVRDFNLPYNSKVDGMGISNVELVKAIKGSYPKRFKLKSPAGDNGANCGVAYLLFTAASQSQLLTVTLPKSDKDGSFRLSSCGLVSELGHFGSAYE